jgi:hypothetical protein
MVTSAWRLRRFERIERLMLQDARRDCNAVSLSSGFIGLRVNSDAPSKLSRYGAGIERNL